MCHRDPSCWGKEVDKMIHLNDSICIVLILCKNIMTLGILIVYFIGRVVMKNPSKVKWLVQSHIVTEGKSGLKALSPWNPHVLNNYLPQNSQTFWLFNVLKTFEVLSGKNGNYYKLIRTDNTKWTLYYGNMTFSLLHNYSDRTKLKAVISRSGVTRMVGDFYKHIKLMWEERNLHCIKTQILGDLVWVNLYWSIY